MTALPTAQIWDLDGTLVDVRGIRHLLETKRKDRYDAFHLASASCPPNEDVVRAARQSHDEGHVNFIFSGRTEKHRMLSVTWLLTHKVPYNSLLMRANGDYRPDFVIKMEMYASLKRRFDIIHATDDRPQVIDLWEFLGIPVTKIPGWE